MNSKTLLLSLVGTGASLATAGLSAIQEKATTTQKPNIIIIYTDDMGVGDISCLNNGWIRTPNIDKLASEGLTVLNYYSAAPVSSPSRVGLTTGMFPLQWGINTFLQTRKGNADCEQFDYLKSDAPSMARVLKTAGYATGHFGKWHMGGGRDVSNAPSIKAYGFDEYASTWESPDPDPAITGDPKWIWSAQDSVKRWNRTAYFVDRTLDFLAKHKGQPCFINLWPDDVHTPWVQDEEAMGNKNSWETRPNFEAVMVEYDKQIGRLMSELKKTKADQNTIIIFTSDNGPAPSFMQIRTNGLRGMKNSLYEGGIKMPFIIRWPERIKPGIIDQKSVVCAVDLLPSLSKITGAKLPKEFEMSGEDRSSAILGTPHERKKDILWEFGRNDFFNHPAAVNRSPHLAIRHGKWKLLTNANGSTIELYNLEEDKNETNNLADKHPDIVKELSQKVLSWWNKRLQVMQANSN